MTDAHVEQLAPIDIGTHPVHLGLGATVEVEPTFTGDPAWYDAYAARHASDGVEARLVSMFTFAEPWTMWEMHPDGGELVLCVAGEMTLHQERADGSRAVVTLTAGQYAVNEPGTWHTADVSATATAVFVTAGAGTEHRPR